MVDDPVLLLYGMTLVCSDSTGSPEGSNVALHGLIPTF
jgi:hypothetical protein